MSNPDDAELNEEIDDAIDALNRAEWNAEWNAIVGRVVEAQARAVPLAGLAAHGLRIAGVRG